MSVELKLNCKILKWCKSPWWCSGSQTTALPRTANVGLGSLLTLLGSATHQNPARVWLHPHTKAGRSRAVVSFPTGLQHSTGRKLFLLYFIFLLLLSLEFPLSLPWNPRGFSASCDFSAQATSPQERAGRPNLKQKVPKMSNKWDKQADKTQSWHLHRGGERTVGSVDWREGLCFFHVIWDSNDGLMLPALPFFLHLTY